MRNINLEKQIISLIPSKTMKKAIQTTNHKFTDLELVQLIFEFAPTWNEMMELLEKIKDEIEDSNLVGYINELIETEKQLYDCLIKKDENYVYEVEMELDTSGSRYLCPDYESCYTTIDSFIKCYYDYYDDYDCEVIKISKRKISIRSNEDDIDNMERPVWAFLNSNKQIIRMSWSWMLDSETAEKYHLELQAIRYPNVFKAGDLVYVERNALIEHLYDTYNYYKDFEKNKYYGINSFDNVLEAEGEIDDCCFLYLSSRYVHFRKIEIGDDGYCDYLMSHSHLDFGYLEKADINTVPKKIKEDYEFTKNKLIELKII